MRVSSKSSGTPTSSVGSAKPTGGASQAGAASPVVGSQGVSDALSVSGTAQFIAVVETHLAQIPDIRIDRVESLRAKIDSDSYHPDGEAVADGIVKDHTPPRRDP